MLHHMRLKHSLTAAAARQKLVARKLTKNYALGDENGVGAGLAYRRGSLNTREGEGDEPIMQIDSVYVPWRGDTYSTSGKPCLPIQSRPKPVTYRTVTVSGETIESPTRTPGNSSVFSGKSISSDVVLDQSMPYVHGKWFHEMDRHSPYHSPKWKQRRDSAAYSNGLMVNVTEPPYVKNSARAFQIGQDLFRTVRPAISIQANIPICPTTEGVEASTYAWHTREYEEKSAQETGISGAFNFSIAALLGQ